MIAVRDIRVGIPRCFEIDPTLICFLRAAGGVTDSRATAYFGPEYKYVSNRNYTDIRLSLKAVRTSPSQFIWDLIQQLSPDQIATYNNLTHVDLPGNLSPEEFSKQLQLAIFQTNAVAAGNNVGLFPTMARLNHGCSGAFNSVYSWREREGVLVVYALKDVNKGEELLTAYFDTRQTRDERR